MILGVTQRVEEHCVTPQITANIFDRQLINKMPT